MNVQNLLEAEDNQLSEYLETVSLEDFRHLLRSLSPPKPPPGTKWKMDNDGRQWVLRRQYETDVCDALGNPVGEKKQAETIVGYFPKFHQALGRMYEGMVADELDVIKDDGIREAVEAAKQILNQLKEQKQ